MSAKERLLLWSQQTTEGYAGIHCENFTTCWRDGRLFNAIIHKYRWVICSLGKCSLQNFNVHRKRALYFYAYNSTAVVEMALALPGQFTALCSQRMPVSPCVSFLPQRSISMNSAHLPWDISKLLRRMSPGFRLFHSPFLSYLPLRIGGVESKTALLVKAVNSCMIWDMLKISVFFSVWLYMTPMAFTALWSLELLQCFCWEHRSTLRCISCISRVFLWKMVAAGLNVLSLRRELYCCMLLWPNSHKVKQALEEPRVAMARS